MNRFVTLSKRKGSADRGASAVLVAMSMLVMMGFAAVAIDSGILFGDRRQQQSGADGGALAAIQFAKTTIPSSNATCNTLTGAPYAACRGAEEAMAVVDGTIPGRWSDADWMACADPNKPAKFSQGSTISPCINFTSNFQEVRVVLPGTDVDTPFGGVIGFDSRRVVAGAEARFDLDQSANIKPWALGPTGSGSNYACLFANSTSNLDVDPCNGPAEGNFGKLDLSLYGNGTLGTPEICGNSMSGTKMAVNLITGADHPMEIAAASPGTVHDYTNCPTITNPVDRVRTQTGNSAGAIEDGFFNGTTATTPDYEGLLMCKDGDSAEYGGYVSTGGCVSVGDQFPEQVDHTPLWDFIASGVSSELPAPGNQCSAVNTQPEMEACLAGWRAWPTPHTFGLFTLDLRYAPRYGAVPILNNDPSGGSGDYDIIAFQPIYADTIYLKCNANTCDIAHSPGIPNSGPCPNPLTSANKSCGWTSTGNKGLVAVTSYMLTIDMLHLDMQENFPGTPGTLVFNLSK